MESRKNEVSRVAAASITECSSCSSPLFNACTNAAVVEKPCRPATASNRSAINSVFSGVRERPEPRFRRLARNSNSSPSIAAALHQPDFRQFRLHDLFVEGLEQIFIRPRANGFGDLRDIIFCRAKDHDGLGA